jgi:hypothetical protein
MPSNARLVTAIGMPSRGWLDHPAMDDVAITRRMLDEALDGLNVIEMAC